MVPALNRASATPACRTWRDIPTLFQGKSTPKTRRRKKLYSWAIARWCGWPWRPAKNAAGHETFSFSQG